MNIQILAAEADTCTLKSVGGIFVESHISPSFLGSSRDVSATNCGPYSHFSPRVFPIAVLLTSREGYSGVQRQAASVWAVVSVVFFPQVQEIWLGRVDRCCHDCEQHEKVEQVEYPHS